MATAKKLTINEAMVVLKQLKERHAELVNLRNQNSYDSTRYFGANADKHETKKPTYSVQHLDELVNIVAREIRVLDLAVKSTNQTTEVAGYKFDEEKVFGSLKAD